MRRAALGLLGVAVAIGITIVTTRLAGRPPAGPQVTAPEPRRLPAPRDPPPPVAAFPPGGRAVVREAVDRYVTEAGLEAHVTEEDRRALVAALARLRRSGRLRARTRVPRPALERRHLRLVLDADRLFREKLGIGVGRFIGAQGAAGQVEDLGGARQ